MNEQLLNTSDEHLHVVAVAFNPDALAEWCKQDYSSGFGVETTHGVPRDAVFIGTIQRRWLAQNAIFLLMTHPTFAMVEPGALIPVIDITFERKRKITPFPGIEIEVNDGVSGKRVVVDYDRRLVNRVVNVGPKGDLEEYAPGTRTLRDDSFALITPFALNTGGLPQKAILTRFIRERFRAAGCRETGLLVRPSGATPRPASRLADYPKSRRRFSVQFGGKVFLLARALMNHSQ